MLIWFPITVLSYLALALSQVLDKVFLTRFVRESRAYGAIIGLMGIVVLFALPWTQSFSSLALWVLALVSGGLFVLALLPFMAALQGDEASRVITATGALVPLLTVLLEAVFLGTRLSGTAYVGIALLVVGSVVLTSSRSHAPRRSYRSMGLALFSAAIFALSFVLTKHVYEHADFLTAFVWMRVGGVIAGAAIVLAVRPVQTELYRLFTQAKPALWAAYLANQAVAAVGFVLQSWAVALTSVGIITAMQGTQYVFVLLFVVLFSRLKPEMLTERITKAVILEKMTATVCIIVGLALLAL